LINNRWL